MINVLMIDDDAGDTLMAKEVLESSGLSIKLHIVHDGVDAMDFLLKQGAYSDAPRPEYILLDLNMPRMTGHEVLNWIKSHEILNSIPVVILTTSDSARDIEECYSNKANCYITKPVDLEDFTKIIEQTNRFWAETAKLPRRT